MNNNKADKLQRRTIIVGLALIITTSLSIYVLYGPEYFNKWPWFRFSVGMSILTCLWSYTFWFFRITIGKEENLQLIIFGLISIPFSFMILYPGTEILGINSDKTVYYLIPLLEIQHGLGFYFIQKGIIRFLEIKKDGKN